MIDPVEDQVFRMRLHVYEKSVALLLSGPDSEENRRWLEENEMLDGLTAMRAEDVRRRAERRATRGDGRSEPAATTPAGGPDQA